MSQHSASATSIGTGQTVTDTNSSVVGKNINFTSVLTNTSPAENQNYDTGAGLLELSTNFTRGLGTGTAQVQWTGSGGFYLDPATFGTHTSYNINIGGLSSPELVTWGQEGFVPDGSALVLDGNFNFENSINLGSDASATRQIDVQNVFLPGSTFASITGSGNLLFQAYGLNASGQSHEFQIINSISISGALELNGVSAFVGASNQTAGLVDVANLHLSNGALYADLATNGQTLRSGANLIMDGGSSYGLGGGSTLGTQTLGQLTSTDATSQIYLGSTQAGLVGQTTIIKVIPAALTINSGYFTGIISDGTTGITETISNPGVGGSIIKIGSSTLSFSGASNTYSAGTTIKQGTLLATNTAGSATGTGAVIVMSGGSLGGTGIIVPSGANNVVVQSGGKVDLTAYDPNYVPSSFTNTLTLQLNSANQATFQNGSTFAFDLGYSGQSDTLAFTGLTLDLTQVFFNDNEVDLNFLTGATTGTYTLFSFDQIGAYSGTLKNTANYTFLYNPSSISVVVTPEPAPAVLTLAGMVVLYLCRKFRSKGQIKAVEHERYLSKDNYL